jgi:hypothetical protein
MVKDNAPFLSHKDNAHVTVLDPRLPGPPASMRAIPATSNMADACRASWSPMPSSRG